jgi:Tol biopolymer transport system component
METLTVVTPAGAVSQIVGAGIDGFAGGPKWSPDGSHVLFSMTPPEDHSAVYMATANGMDVTQITVSDLPEEAQAWLP